MEAAPKTRAVMAVVNFMIIVKVTERGRQRRCGRLGRRRVLGKSGKTARPLSLDNLGALYSSGSCRGPSVGCSSADRCQGHLGPGLAKRIARCSNETPAAAQCGFDPSLQLVLRRECAYEAVGSRCGVLNMHRAHTARCSRRVRPSRVGTIGMSCVLHEHCIMPEGVTARNVLRMKDYECDRLKFVGTVAHSIRMDSGNHS